MRGSWVFRWLAPLTLCAAIFVGRPAIGEIRSFESGSLIIPMDLTYQDEGMFLAYGLLYQLLLNDIPVYWIIDRTKLSLDTADMVASATDLLTDGVITEHGYLAGPFVVDAVDAARATPIVAGWQVTYPQTAVHMATTAFKGNVNKKMTAAPTIAIYADGTEDIAFGYLNAAAIPDSLGQPWPAAKDKTMAYPDHPDVLTVAEVRGPTATSDVDGALFDEQGLPVYCEMMSMHLKETERDDEAIAEIREFLYYPTHFFAECQAVNTIENSVNGHFLTTEGFVMDDKPGAVDVVSPYLPFNQFDGTFEPVGGSEPSYTLRDEDSDGAPGVYHDDGVVMLSAAGTGIGDRDVWMTGYVDGICTMPIILARAPGNDGCNEGVGKVSYLGGHKYATSVPVSANPDGQGTRLFLNALFEADCVTTVGQPNMVLYLEVPPFNGPDHVTVTLTYQNNGFGVANEVTVVLSVPAGATVDDASLAYQLDGNGALVFNVGNMAPRSEGTITLTLAVVDEADLAVGGTVNHKVGQNARTSDGKVVLPGNVPTDTDSTGWGESSGDTGQRDTSAANEDTSGAGSRGDTALVADSSGNDDAVGDGNGGTDSGGCGCKVAAASTGSLLQLIFQ